MKKTILWIIVCVVMIAGILVLLANTLDLPALDFLRFRKEKVAATVNGQQIYWSTVNERVENINLIYEAGIECTENSDLSDEKKQETIQQMQNRPTQSRDEILDSLIRNTVAYQQAEKDGLVPSYEEAYEANEQNYQLAKTYAEDNNYANEDTILAYEILKAYMKAKHWNEKEYLEQTAYEYQINMAVGNLYNKFKESYADEADENKIRAAYEDYLDILVEEADIQYFDME